MANIPLLNMAIIWSAKEFALQLCLRVFALLQTRAFKRDIKGDTKQDVYLKGVILALLWEREISKD